MRPTLKILRVRDELRNRALTYLEENGTCTAKGLISRIEGITETDIREMGMLDLITDNPVTISGEEFGVYGITDKGLEHLGISVEEHRRDELEREWNAIDAELDDTDSEIEEMEAHRDLLKSRRDKIEHQLNTLEVNSL